MMCFLQNSSPYSLIQVYIKLKIQSFSVHFSVDIIICLTAPQILINVATVRWITAHINIATTLYCVVKMAPTCVIILRYWLMTFSTLATPAN